MANAYLHRRTRSTFFSNFASNFVGVGSPQVDPDHADIHLDLFFEPSGIVNDQGTPAGVALPADRWLDSSGSQWHGERKGLATVEHFSSGFRGVSLDGVDQAIILDAESEQLINDTEALSFTIAFQGRNPEGLAEPQAAFGIRVSGTTDPFLFVGLDTAGRITAQAIKDHGDALLGVTASEDYDGSWVIVTVELDYEAGEARLWVNGDLADENLTFHTGRTDNADAGELNFGSFGNDDYPFNGVVGGFGFRRGKLTEGERQMLEGYLSSQLGDIPLNMPVKSLWAGVQYDDAAKITQVKARIPNLFGVASLLVSDNAAMGGSTEFALASYDDDIASFSVFGLDDDMTYFYAVRIDDFIVPFIGRFRTAGAGAHSFKFAIGSCSGNQSPTKVSDARVWRKIVQRDPHFFIHCGDLHYKDDASPTVAERLAIYDEVQAAENFDFLQRSLAMAYIWDDHDFQGNNSDGTAPNKAVALEAFQRRVPNNHENPVFGCYFTFNRGRVKFIVLDCRYSRSPSSATDNASKTMLGDEQKAWLFLELEDARSTGKAVVIVSSIGWVAPSATGDDNWGRYSTERTEIADKIKLEGLTDSTMILCGDSHNLTAYDPDNQVNGDYATGAGANMVVIHAGPIDNRRHDKANAQVGPFHIDPHFGTSTERRHQWGDVTITDTNGPSVGVNFKGIRLLGAEMTEEIDFSFSLAIP